MESLAVLDVHIAARWKHDTKTGPQVVRRNANDLQSIAADNGFQDWHTEYEIAAHDVEYLVHYRGSSAKAAVTNSTFSTRTPYVVFLNPTVTGYWQEAQ